MGLVSNVCKGWNTGQYLGDLVLGHATAIPGFALDILVTPIAFTPLKKRMRLKYEGSEGDSWSRTFALPGKIVGNIIIPMAFTIIAAALSLPHALIDGMDQSYQYIADRIDKVMSSLSKPIAPTQENFDYFEKSFFSGVTLLGSLCGAILSPIGLLIDGACALVGFKKDLLVTKKIFKYSRNSIGLLGGMITGAIGMALAPVKVVLDAAFFTYRGFCKILDKIAAFFVSKNGGDPDIQMEMPNGTMKNVYTQSFRAKIAVASEFTFLGFFMRLFRLTGGQKLIKDIDSITQEPLNHSAVIVCNNGHNENDEGESGVKQHGACPECRGPLLPTFIPNVALRNVIRQKTKKNKDALTLNPLDNTSMVICDKGHSINKKNERATREQNECPCCKGSLLRKFIPNIAFNNVISDQLAAAQTQEALPQTPMQAAAPTQETVLSTAPSQAPMQAVIPVQETMLPQTRETTNETASASETNTPAPSLMTQARELAAAQLAQTSAEVIALGALTSRVAASASEAGAITHSMVAAAISMTSSWTPSIFYGVATNAQPEETEEMTAQQEGQHHSTFQSSL